MMRSDLKKKKKSKIDFVNIVISPNIVQKDGSSVVALLINFVDGVFLPRPLFRLEMKSGRSSQARIDEELSECPREKVRSFVEQLPIHIITFVSTWSRDGQGGNNTKRVKYASNSYVEIGRSGEGISYLGEKLHGFPEYNPKRSRWDEEAMDFLVLE